MRIAIIGCGYAGLATALSIKHHEITIFEQAEKLKPVGAGVLLQPLGFEVLKQFGLQHHANELGDPIDQLYGINHKGKLILDLKYSLGQQGLGIHRGFLFERLVGSLDRHRVSILAGESIEKIEMKDGRSLLFGKKDVYEDFDVVVVSNGAKSQFRALLPGFQYQKEYPWGAFWGIFENRGLKRNILYQKYHGTKKLFGLLPCGTIPSEDKAIVNFFWSVRKDHVEEIYRGGIDSLKDEILKYDPTSNSVLDQIDSFEQLIFTSYHDVYCQKWNIGNLVFAGDAVHGMSPQLGIGLNVALMDGYLLGQILNREGFQLSDLSKLRTMRARQNFYYHMTSQVLTRFFQSDLPMLGHLRDRTFPFFPKVSWINHLMVDSLCGQKTGVWSRASAEEQIKRIHQTLS